MVGERLAAPEMTARCLFRRRKKLLFFCDEILSGATEVTPSRMTVSGGAVRTDGFVGAGKKDVYRRGVQQILPIDRPFLFCVFQRAINDRPYKRRGGLNADKAICVAEK